MLWRQDHVTDAEINIVIDTGVDSREDLGERGRDTGTDIAIEVEGYEVDYKVVEACLKKSASI
jgi:hypothetical protein